MTPSSLIAVVAQLPAQPARGSERVELSAAHARRALELSAHASGCDVGAFEKDQHGAPRPAHGWHWSLSHGRERVAACVHRAAVGIDVEDLREVRRELLERVLDERERALDGLAAPLGFLRAWTAKEALLKELGLGLQGLSRCSITAVLGPDELVATCDGAVRRIRQQIGATHVVSVSSADDAPVTWSESGAALVGGGRA